MAFLVFFFYNLIAKSGNYHVLVLLGQIVKEERLVSNITFNFIALGMKHLFYRSQGEVIFQKQNDTWKRVTCYLFIFLIWNVLFFLVRKQPSAFWGIRIMWSWLDWNKLPLYWNWEAILLKFDKYTNGKGDWFVNMTIRQILGACLK